MFAVSPDAMYSCIAAIDVSTGWVPEGASARTHPSVSPGNRERLRPSVRRSLKLSTDGPAERAVQRGPVQEHDRLAVSDPAVGDHRQGLCERQLDDLDVLSV